MSNIAYADTDIVYLAILDILTPEKRALVERTRSGPLALGPLEAMADRLAVVTHKGKPYAQELAAADQQHDIGAMVLDLVCRAHELLGALPRFAELARRGRKVRDNLSMGRTIITASYQQEAANAHRNRRLLPDIAAELSEMPITRGVTALDIAEMFIEGGEEIGRLLGRRADALALAQSARNEAGGVNLLHEARDLLMRLRSLLDNEVSLRDDLPDDLVPRVFSVLDERLAAAEARARSGAASAVTPAAEGEGRDGTAAEQPDLDGGASVGADGAGGGAEAPEAGGGFPPLNRLPRSED